MKKLITIAILIIGMMASAQEFSQDAIALHDAVPDRFKSIALLAVERWKNNESMQIEFINDQVECFHLISEISRSKNCDRVLMGIALAKNERFISGVSCIDFDKTIYDYKKLVRENTNFDERFKNKELTADEILMLSEQEFKKYRR
jgi:hypothetical protein